MDPHEKFDLRKIRDLKRLHQAEEEHIEELRKLAK